MIAWIQFIIGATLIAAGVVALALSLFGVYRFNYVLNRMHAAAMGDTLALLFACVGLCVGASDVSVVIKLLVLVVFMWMASPVSSHLIARTEEKSNPDIHKEAEEMQK